MLVADNMALGDNASMDKLQSPTCAERLLQFQLRNNELAESMLPAELSAAAYGELSWAWDVAAGAPVEAWASSLGEGLHNLPRALFLRSVASPVLAADLGIDAQAHGASFERGVWSKGSLAQALCAKASDGSGGQELHLAIRGTDPASDASATRSLLNTVFGYLIWTYPRINIHGESFAALAEAIASHAANPDNKITKIVLSGHSLGAAGAEAILPILRRSGIEVRSHFFGNPGRGPGWSTVAFTGLRAAAAIASSVCQEAIEAIPARWEKAKAFAGVVGTPVSWASRMLASVGRREDASIVNWRNPGDPVPKLGALLYASDGIVRKLSWAPINDAKWWQVWRFGELAKGRADCHSMSKYALTIARSLRGMLDVGGKLSPLASARWGSYDEALRRAGEMRLALLDSGFDAPAVQSARARVIAEGSAWPTMQGARLEKLAKSEEGVGAEAFKAAATAQMGLIEEIATPKRKSFTAWLVARRMIGPLDEQSRTNEWSADRNSESWKS